MLGTAFLLQAKHSRKYAPSHAQNVLTTRITQALMNRNHCSWTKLACLAHCSTTPKGFTYKCDPWVLEPLILKSNPNKFPQPHKCGPRTCFMPSALPEAVCKPLIMTPVAVPLGNGSR